MNDPSPLSMKASQSTEENYPVEFGGKKITTTTEKNREREMSDIESEYAISAPCSGILENLYRVRTEGESVPGREEETSAVLFTSDLKKFPQLYLCVRNR